MDVTKPYKSIGSGAMDVTKPYTFIGLGAMGGGRGSGGLESRRADKRAEAHPNGPGAP